VSLALQGEPRAGRAVPRGARAVRRKTILRVRGAVHTLQAQAAVHARMRSPEVLPAECEQQGGHSVQRGNHAAASSTQRLADMQVLPKRSRLS